MSDGCLVRTLRTIPPCGVLVVVDVVDVDVVLVVVAVVVVVVVVLVLVVVLVGIDVVVELLVLVDELVVVVVVLVLVVVIGAFWLLKYQAIPPSTAIIITIIMAADAAREIARLVLRDIMSPLHELSEQYIILH